MIDVFVHGKVCDVQRNLSQEYCVVVTCGSLPPSMTNPVDALSWAGKCLR